MNVVLLVLQTSYSICALDLSYLLLQAEVYCNRPMRCECVWEARRWRGRTMGELDFALQGSHLTGDWLCLSGRRSMVRALSCIRVPVPARRLAHSCLGCFRKSLVAETAISGTTCKYVFKILRVLFLLQNRSARRNARTEFSIHRPSRPTQLAT